MLSILIQPRSDQQSLFIHELTLSMTIRPHLFREVDKPQAEHSQRILCFGALQALIFIR